MISQTLARRYAQALLALGREEGAYAQYGQELDDFTKLATASELDEVLANPIYPADVRRKLLDEVIEKMGPSQVLANLLRLLLEKGRIGHVEAINNFYQRLVDEINNVQRASVTAAAPISDDMQREVQQTLEKMTGKSVVLEVKEDPSIIGGLVAKVGDLTLDGSVKTQLENLKESLIKG